MWLLHCPRQLSLNELAVAAVIAPDSDFEEIMRLTTPSDILDICGSFIKMDEKSVVELAHFSVTEFFMLPRFPDGSTNEYVVDKDEAYRSLLKACFSYLRSPCFALVPYYSTRIHRKALVRDDFYVSASLCWPRLAQSKPHDLAMSQEIYTFLNADGFNAWSSFWYFMKKCYSLNFWTWHFVKVRDISRYSPLPTDTSITWTPRRPMASPLYVAANLSLPCVVQIILDHGVEPNQQGGELEYPIFAAIAGYNEEVLTKLLSAGADVSLRQHDGWTPLHDAVMRGSLPLIRLLIGFKADITAEVDNVPALLVGLRAFPFYKRELSKVRIHSQTDREPDPEIVRLLLSNGDHDEKVLRHALAIAVSREFPTVGRILVMESKPIFPINWQDARGNTFLHVAAVSGNLGPARLLLEAGADETIQNWCGHQAVHLAASLKSPELLRIMAKVTSEVRGVSYLLDSLDLTSLRNLADDGHVKDHIELLLHLASLYPNDHVWRIHLALLCFKLGDHSTAAKLREQSLQINPQNNQVTFIENLAQSVECEECREQIYGRHWTCGSCYSQVCNSCQVSKRDETCASRPSNYYNISFEKRQHELMGFLAYHCTLGAGRLIGFENDRYQREYRLVEEAKGSESYYVCDETDEKRYGPSQQQYTQSQLHLPQPHLCQPPQLYYPF